MKPREVHRLRTVPHLSLSPAKTSVSGNGDSLPLIVQRSSYRGQSARLSKGQILTTIQFHVDRPVPISLGSAMHCDRRRVTNVHVGQGGRGVSGVGRDWPRRARWEAAWTTSSMGRADEPIAWGGDRACPSGISIGCDHGVVPVAPPPGFPGRAPLRLRRFRSISDHAVRAACRNSSRVDAFGAPRFAMLGIPALPARTWK